jgi:anthranilate synthase component 1
MFSDLVVLDHLSGELLLVANIFVTENCQIEREYESATARINQMRRDLLKPLKPFVSQLNLEAPLQTLNRTAPSDFVTAVEKAKERVAAGDVFQVVLSQRFDEPIEVAPLDAYRVLRSINPSPYMYLLSLNDGNGDFSIVGSSPEALFTLTEGKAVMHPIAGSRPRGATTEADNHLADELVADSKETAEHLMLVDLARNDLLKVCKSSSVEVTEFMQIRRFSHIMHLVSTVEGELSGDANAVDAFRATFPAGTLSGAPKPKALEIIEQLEQTNRGLFGGVVGYFDFAGNADLAIAIRTAFIRNGTAHVQAGAGIVLDSIAESERIETVNKAKATLRAVAASNSMRALDD